MTDHALADVESGVYELHYKIRPGDCVVDIGAHVGHFTKMALEKVGRDGIVFAIEPHPVNYRELKKLRLECSNVWFVEAAAWDFDGEIVLNHCEKNDGAHSVFKHGSSSDIQIVVKCLDVGDFLKDKLSLSRLCFIKIDAEGSEYHILKSLMEHGIKCPMAVEIHSEELFDQCRRLLSLFGCELRTQNGQHVGVCYVCPSPAYKE